VQEKDVRQMIHLTCNCLLY